MKASFPSLASLLLATLSLTACKDRDGLDDSVAELAADSTGAVEDEGALLAAAVDGMGSTFVPATADQAATFIAARAAQRYIPADCVTVTQAGLTVTLAFDGCLGPRGLRELNGTMVLQVSAGAGGAIVVDATASDFHIGLSTLDIDATATYTASAASESLAVVTSTTGVGGRGFELAHDGDYTLTWDDQCVMLEGAWSSSRGDASRATTADVTRCVDACPIGEVTRTTVNGRTITVTFDGTATARWSSSGGRSGEFPLACGL